MKAAWVVLVMLACCGCGSGGNEVPAPARVPGPTAAIVNRAWMRSDSTGLPGVMRIFLSDGTLVMDSCWETYQLAKWRAESDSVLAWHEGSAEVRATILALSENELLLRVGSANGGNDEHYRVAPVPYLCPDMRR